MANLKENEALINYNTGDLVFLISVDANSCFRCLSSNQNGFNDLNQTTKKVNGKLLDEIWSEENVELFRENFKSAVKQKHSLTYRVNYNTIHPSVSNDITITPIFNSAGVCTSLFCISRNTKIDGDYAFTESTHLFQDLFEYSPLAIFIHNKKEITQVNRSFLKIFGYSSKEEILGKPPMETLVYEKDYKIVKEGREQESKKSYHFMPRIRYKRGDGSVFISASHVSFIKIDGKPHIWISARDITEIAKAEQELKKSENKYRELFKNSPDGIYKSTPAGKFIDVNPALVNMLGYDSEEELLAIDITNDLYFKEEERIVVSTPEEDRYRLRKKDGSEIWVADHGYYEYDEDGKIIFNHGILRDITQRIEEQKRLEKLLAVTSNQNERLQNFAYIVSHNIRSHSANMSALIQFIETSSEEDRKELLSMLKISIDKLDETVKNLSEIISVDESLNKKKKACNLLTEVKNTLKILSYDIRENKIKVNFDISPEIEVFVIPAYLDSILINLITNAIKYKSNDRDPIIEIKASTKSNSVSLAIKDNGIGIDLKKYGDKLFGMYQTFHSNDDARGFGLYITKNQIESMDGTIEMKSTVGKGSTFTIQFAS